MYVDAPARGSGIGTALLRHLARVALAAGCGRIEWSSGADNHRGLEFYRRNGARVRDHVRLCRLDQAATARLAEGSDTALDGSSPTGGNGPAFPIP